MKIIKGHGRPTANTSAKIGTIYRDVDSGLRYKCHCIFSSMGRNEYQWKPVEIEVESEPEEAVDIFEETEEYVEPEPKVEPVRKNNYHKQYNKANKK